MYSKLLTSQRKPQQHYHKKTVSFGEVEFMEEPTSKNVSLKLSEATQWSWDLSLHNGYGFDDDDDDK